MLPLLIARPCQPTDDARVPAAGTGAGVGALQGFGGEKGVGRVDGKEGQAASPVGALSWAPSRRSGGPWPFKRSPVPGDGARAAGSGPGLA